MASTDDFIQYVSKRQRKEKKIMKQKERNRILNTFLLSEELKEVCILWLIGRCKRGDKCRFKHVDIKESMYAFARSLFYNFTYIDGIEFNRGNIITYIMAKLNNGLNVNLTNCTFYQKGTKCKNEGAGRLIEFPMKFNGKPMTLHVCYADTKRCQTQLLCGMHIDFVIDETMSRFSVRNIISEKNEQIHDKPVFRKTKQKKLDIDSMKDFPNLGDKDTVSAVSAMSTVSSASSESIGQPAVKKSRASYSKAAVMQNPFIRKKKSEKSKAVKAVKAVEAVEAVEAVDAVKAVEAVKAVDAVDAVVYKHKLSMLTDDDFSTLAQDIFDDEIDDEETDEEKIKRLERENVILFKRNIQLTDELCSCKIYSAYEDNRDNLRRHRGIDIEYASDSDEFNELDEFEEFDE